MGEAIILHVFIDQNSCGSINATATKCDKILMLDCWESCQLRCKFPLPSHWFKLNWKHFYPHNCAISKPALHIWLINQCTKSNLVFKIDIAQARNQVNLVYRTKAAFTDLVRTGEILGRISELVVRKYLKRFMILSSWFWFAGIYVIIYIYIYKIKQSRVVNLESKE